MDEKLQKIMRKWRGNANPHEQAVAQGKAERRCALLGMTFADAVAQLDALDRPTSAPRWKTPTSEPWEDHPWAGGRARQDEPKPKPKPKPKPRRFTLTDHEEMIFEAVKMWRKIDPETGWSSNFGPMGGAMPFDVHRRVLRAVAMPQCFDDAMDELARWDRLVEERKTKPRSAALDPIIWARIREVESYAQYRIDLFHPEDILARAKLMLKKAEGNLSASADLATLVRDLERMTLWSRKEAAE